MSDPIARTDLDRRSRDVDDGNLQLVARAAIVGVDNTDAVGDHQAALERCAAAGEHRQEHLGGDFDYQPGWDQRHFSRGDDDGLGSGEIERRRAGGLISGNLDVRVKPMDANGWHALTIFQCQQPPRPVIMGPPTPWELT